MARTPTLGPDRIIQLDIFRGFAILGIFMVNILVMNVSFVYREDWLMENQSSINDSVDWTLQLFFFSKFFPIFSFLFGMGVALQIRSLHRKSMASVPFLTRRFLALLIFGICHILLIWSGDILHLYALFGFVLMLMYRTPPIIIFLTALVIFFFPYVDEIYEFILSFLNIDTVDYLSELTREKIHALKVNGSYTSGIELRIKEYGFMLPFVVSFMIPIALGMTLLGLYVVKKGFIDRLYDFSKKILFPFLIALILILGYRFFFQYWILVHVKPEFGTLLSFFLWTFYILSEVMISLFYLLMIVFILRSKKGRALLHPLSYVGRMAFTNYILQSVIGYLIMRTFGLYESFDLLDCVLIVLTVFACQIPLSWFWLKHFNYGPLEWLWRCVSYWKVLPIRKHG